MSKIELDKEEKEVFELIKEFLTKKSIINVLELQNLITPRLRNNPNWIVVKINVFIILSNLKVKIKVNF